MISRLRSSLHTTAWAAWVLLVIPGTACDSVPTIHGNSDQSPRLVVTQVPAGDGKTRTAERLDFDARYPTGSRIVLIASEGAPRRSHPISASLVAAGAPDVSPAADSVLFAGKREPDSKWAIFEVGIRDLVLRRVVETDRDCGDPAYLAHDRLVFVCADETAPSPEPPPPSWSLYVASRDGSGMERITFGPGSAFDPSPLQDGRIVFSMWQGAGTALYTLNPDGTLLDVFTGAHEPPLLKVRPRQTWDGGVIFLSAEPEEGTRLVERVEMGRPLKSRRALKAGAGFIELETAEPLPGGGLLLAGRTAAAKTSGIFRSGSDGRSLERVFDTPDWDEVEAIPLIATTMPKGRPSALDRTLSTGKLLCYDVQRSDGLVARPHALFAEVSVETGGPRSPIRLGEAPVERDGSFYLEVPADVPIRLSAFTADGQQARRSGWFWIRPGEVRACFGCHENREAAPVNRPIEALAHPPHRVSRRRELQAP